jgi:hypothetical protein
MSDSDETPAAAKERKAREAAARLWDEYSYRHDMIWKLVFRVTAVATAVAIAPFLLNDKAQDVLNKSLIFLPVLAVLVIALGILALPSEFKMLKRVKKAYQWSQDETFDGVVPRWKSHRDSKDWLDRFLPFECRIYVFLSLVLAGAVVFLFLFAFKWSGEI